MAYLRVIRKGSFIGTSNQTISCATQKEPESRLVTLGCLPIAGSVEIVDAALPPIRVQVSRSSRYTGLLTDGPRECLRGGYYADPADIWSLGVILFSMVTCSHPWNEARPTDKEYITFISKRDHFLRTYPISESLSALLHQIWHPIPMRRMSIPAIRQAILEMDTFYRPLIPSHAAPPLSKVVLVDS